MMTSTSIPLVGRLDRARFLAAADWVAVAVAVALPWSTALSSALIVLWLAAVLPTLELRAVRREVETAAGGLPVLLWALAAVGMLWAQVSWHDRLHGLGGFHKLLVIPLLLAHFRRSERGAFALYGFIASAAGLLLASWALALIPPLTRLGRGPGIPANDYIYQSGIFLLCAFALLGAAREALMKRRWGLLAALVILAALFLANIAFVVTSRTSLLVAPVLVLALGWRLFGAKGALAACLVAAVLAAGAWLGSSYLRDRVIRSVDELQAYVAANSVNSTSLHLEFLRESVRIVKEAPLIGHGTGSMKDEFRQLTEGQTGLDSVVTSNPHNQTFVVAIQFGFAGVAVLLAMWIAHLLLFRGSELTAWIGLLVVLQNIASSLFNSHLLDFNEGWLYVFGVGIAGGMLLRRRDATSPAQ